MRAGGARVRTARDAVGNAAVRLQAATQVATRTAARRLDQAVRGLDPGLNSSSVNGRSRVAARIVSDIGRTLS